MNKIAAMLLFVLIAIPQVTSAQTREDPPYKKEFNRASWDARELKEKCQYAEARKLMKDYIGKYKNNKLAARELKEAGEFVSRFERLHDLWLKAKKSPETEAYKFAAALIEKDLPFGLRSSPSERFKVFELMRDHDVNMKKKIAARFPMSITIKWTEKGNFTEYEELYLHELGRVSKEAKIPVVHGVGNWSVGHSLRFTPLGKTWSSTRMKSFKLGGDCRVKDEKGELQTSWEVSKTNYHISEETAKQNAAKKLGQEFLDRIVLWLLTEQTGAKK